MASRESIYTEFGRASEIAQAIEFDLGRALLAHEGLDQRVYVFDSWEPQEALLDAIRKKTLGQSLQSMRARYNLLGDVGPVLDGALRARNHLAHNFFGQHTVDMESDAGRDSMIRHLEHIQRDLWAGYQMAREMADYLVSQLEGLAQEHGSAPERDGA